MAAPIELQTEDRLEYSFFPNDTGFVQFRVRAPHDAHIALTHGSGESDPMYEIYIGGWSNSKSVIRKNRTKPDVMEVPTPGILDGGEFRGFWIRWGNNSISAGREGSQTPFIQWHDPEYVPIGHVGVCTGWGATGSWIIEPPQPGHYGGGGGGSSMGFQAGNNYGQGGGNACNSCWVGAAGGSVPPRAYVGGEDNGEPLYVIRANYQGALIPGKLVASHGTGYIAWGGAENPVPQYEVLCDFGGRWQACSGGNVPPNAFPAGQSEEGEPLYVGRVVHEGTLTIGKVQQSHGCCYIPYGGQELNFQQYEILVS